MIIVPFCLQVRSQRKMAERTIATMTDKEIHLMAQFQIKETNILLLRNRSSALEYLERKAVNYLLYRIDDPNHMLCGRFSECLPTRPDSQYKFSVSDVLTMFMGNIARRDKMDYVIYGCDATVQHMTKQIHDDMFDLIGELWIDAPWFRFRDASWRVTY